MRRTPSRRASRRRIGAIALGATAVIYASSAFTQTTNAGAIVGGEATDIATVPYQVALVDDGGQFCGGSILDATTVITAAHCVEGMSAAAISIRAGVADLRSDEGVVIGVAGLEAHERYATDEVGDVAVLRLASPLVFGSTVQPIELATAAEVAAASSARVSGWGTTSENGDPVDVLRSVVEPLIGDRACGSDVDGFDDATELCAGGSGVSSCYGDSGGPLAITTGDGTTKLAGIVSWGEICGEAPGVYAEVPAFAEWIDARRTGELPDVAPGGDDAGWDDAGWDDAGWDDAGWDDAGWDDADADWSEWPSVGC